MLLVKKQIQELIDFRNIHKRYIFDEKYKNQTSELVLEYIHDRTEQLEFLKNPVFGKFHGYMKKVHTESTIELEQKINNLGKATHIYRELIKNIKSGYSR